MQERRLYSVNKYGYDPIYTKDTFPKEFVISEVTDIVNIRIKKRLSAEAYYNTCKDIIYNMHHGQIYEPREQALSTDVFSNTIHGLNEAEVHGWGEFYISNKDFVILNGLGRTIPYSALGMETINTQIDRVNERYNKNIPHCIWETEETDPNKYYTNTVGKLKVPVIGFKRY